MSALFNVIEIERGKTTYFRNVLGGGRVFTARGGGKGGGGGGSPEESPDSLFSTQYARILFAVGEGEIEGPARGGLKWVFFDNTALENVDGSMNFRDVRVEWRNGTLDQSHIPGFPGVEAQRDVGLEVTKANSVIKTITNPNANAARITMSWQGLSVVDSSGDVRPAWGEYAVDVRVGAGAWEEVLYVKFSGKTTSKYQRSHRIEKPGGYPWDIRVRRLYPDATTNKRTDKSFWESITEITDRKFRYPMTAVYGVEINAQQFSSIPTVAFDLYLLKVRVPTNYDPWTRTYTGAWDGTFKISWTDNPAWVFYDVVTRKRYGLGRFVSETAVDKWALYSIGKYCDDLVPNGKGGFEPRFTCNLYLQAQESAQKVLSDLASIFRAMVYWGGGQVVASQDAPADISAVYSTASVKDGKFIRQGSSVTKRYTVAHVTYNDPDDFYRQKIEYVEDREGIKRYGIRETEIIAFGCASRGQANRLGRWFLYSSRLEGGIITWRVSLEGLKSRPGQIAAISDTKKVGRRMSGRIVSATGTTVTLDRPYTLAPGVAYSITVVGLDGKPQKRAVTTPASTTAGLTVATAFDSVPGKDSVWIIAEPALEPELVRIVGVSEVEPNEYELTAVAHNPSKFNFIEQDMILEERQTSNIDVAPKSPENLEVAEYQYEAAGGVLCGALLSWDSTPTATYYDITYKVNDEAAVNLNRQKTISIDLKDILPGTLSFSVRAINLLGKPSPWSSKTVELLGKAGPPDDPTEFGLSAIDTQSANLTFPANTNLDVRIGGHWVVRHTSDIGPGIGWADGFEIGRFPGNSRQGLVPLLAGTYILKALDSSGVYSQGFLKVETEAPNVLAYIPMATISEEPAFAGVTDGTRAVGGQLYLGHSGMVDDEDDFDAIDDLDDLGDLYPSGTYDFANILNFGALYSSVRIQATIKSAIVVETDQIDARPGTVDSWDSWDATDASLSNVRMLISTTSDDPTGSPTWSAYQPFVAGHYAGRAARFRAEITTLDPGQNALITSLGAFAEIPPRIEEKQNIASLAGPTPITFAKKFAARPAIAVTAENMASGDKAIISNQSDSGFTVEFKTSGAVSVSRVFDYIAKGHGQIN